MAMTVDSTSTAASQIQQNTEKQIYMQQVTSRAQQRAAEGSAVTDSAKGPAETLKKNAEALGRA